MNTILEETQVTNLTPEQELQELNTKLRELSPKATKRMRAKWALDNFTSAATVDRYFKGQTKMVNMIGSLRKLYDDISALITVNVEI